MILPPNTAGDWLQLAAVVACLALLVTAAIGDVRHYRISNRLVIAVAVAFAVFAAAEASWIFLAWSLAVAACMFAVAALMFAFGLIGGGDAKLAAALALWIPFVDLPRFVLVMTASGGVLGVVWMIRRLLKQRAAAVQSPAEGEVGPVPQASAALANKLPYGVAIAIAGFDFFLFSGNSPLAGLLSGQ